MRFKPWPRIAPAAMLTVLAPFASAQELPLRTTVVDDRTVVMMPVEDLGMAGGPGIAADPSLSGA